MISVVAALAFTTAVTLSAGATGKPLRQDPGTLRTAVSRISPVETSTRLQSATNDSLKNGATIGAVVGGLLVALAASTGCAAGDILSGEESSCAGPMIVGGAIGAGLGALVGVGIDAMFEQAPAAGFLTAGRRKGIRLRVRF